jgi:S1-C subfamily serine protease
MQLVSLPDTVRAQFKTASGSGLLAVHVEPESPAGRSRVLLGDLIVGIGGKPVGSVSALQDALSELRSGQQVKLSLLRGGEPRDVEITIADWPERR